MATASISPTPDAEQLPPVEEVPLPPDPPSFGKNNRELPEQLKNALEAIVKDFQNRDLYDRRIEVLMDRILRFYDDGVQHIYPNYGTGVYQIGVAGGYVDVGNDRIQCPEYMGAYNIFRARRRTLDAVLTQNPPGVDFRPDSPDRDEDLQAAETAEGYRHLFDQANDVRSIQQQISRMFELSGRCVTWTHTVADGEKFGYNEEDEPKQMEVCEVFGTLESKVPILARGLECSSFAFLYKDPDLLTARKENPWLKQDGAWKFSGGESAPGESDWERFARLGVRQAKKGYYLTGSAYAHLVTEMHAFLRPDAFESQVCDAAYTGPQGLDEEGNPINEPSMNEDGSGMTLRDKLKELFPEGVHVTYIGRCFSEAAPASMDDNIDIGFPTERDGQSGGALMEPMKVIQDAFNDFKNAEREFYEKGWPVTWFKGNQESYDAFIDQQSRPAQFAMIQDGGPPDQPLSNLFYREPDMEAPETFVQAMLDYQGPLSQDVTGALPSLAGEGNPDQKTATGQAMLRAQAMGALGPAWSNIQRLFAGIYEKAALAASKNPDHAKEITVVSGEGQTISIQLEKLQRGKFHCHPDVDSTFPESTAAKRATMQTLLPMIAASPVGLEFIKSPDNWETFLDLSGFPEITLTPALAYKKQIREFEVLLREAPVPNQAAVEAYDVQHAQQALQAVQQGLPEPPYTPPPAELPSVMPKKRDYHQWELAKCQEYLSGVDAWRQEAQGNTQGIRNIELHADMHEMMMAAQAPQAPQPMPAMPMPKKGAAAAQAPEGNTQVQAASQPPGAPNQPTM